jgi:uncharacterized membrane protein
MSIGVKVILRPMTASGAIAWAKMLTRRDIFAIKNCRRPDFYTTLELQRAVGLPQILAGDLRT